MAEQTVPGVRAPSPASVRDQIERLTELWLDAMFLQRQAYAYQRDQKNQFGNGLVYIALIGVIVAAAGILGTMVRYATTPTPEAIKNTVLVHLQAMPYLATLSAGAQDAFLQGYDQAWDLLGSVFVGYPTDTAAFVGVALTILTTPLGLILGWLIYGGLVHLVARGWNPETSFPELLAPLALATSPQLLNVLAIFPAVSASGAVVALWSFICSILAIRVAYETTTRRAVWGALFPLLILALLALVPLILGLLALGARRGG